MKRFIPTLLPALIPTLFGVALAIFATPALADLVINEARTDQSGTDDDEYFELYADGMSFADLSSYTYIVIGDGAAAAGSGVIENVTALSGSLNAGEFLLVAEDSDTFGAAADIIATLNFENGDNVTHMLVQDFTGSNGQDLDTNDDGVLDATPWSAIIDDFAIAEFLGDLVYSTNLVTTGNGFQAAHAYRDVDGTAGTWQVGAFDPLNGNDTPGSTNNPSSVPEPGTATLIGLAFLAFGFVRFRK